MRSFAVVTIAAGIIGAVLLRGCRTPLRTDGPVATPIGKTDIIGVAGP